MAILDPSEHELLHLFDHLTELIVAAHRDIPAGLAEFKKQKKLTPDSLDYDEEERRADRQRVVRFVSAETALEGFEDQLMLDYVVRPSDSLLGPFESAWTALHKSAPLLWSVAKGSMRRLVRGELMILYILAAVIVLSVLVTSTFDLKRIARAHKSSLDFYVKILRKAALPQRSATRHRVRKRTRE